MAEDLTSVEDAELERRVREVRDHMRPLEDQLADLRRRRDVFLTELRRRERLATRARRGIRA